MAGDVQPAIFGRQYSPALFAGGGPCTCVWPQPPAGEGGHGGPVFLHPADRHAAAEEKRRRPLKRFRPTRNSPELLERALRSLVTAMAPVAEHVEVTVSDGSEANTSGRVVDRLLKDWPGGHRYVWNRPALTLVEDMNRAAELATGEWVQQLDDDDLMLPSCGQPMIDCLRRVAPQEQVLLFGAHIVDAGGVKRREQIFGREQYLSPRGALRRLLRNSSFVREPMVVVRRAALVEAGLFELEVGDATDTDMWVRLFSRHGARCLPVTTCAYTIHEAAATMGYVESRHDRGARHRIRPGRRFGRRPRA